MEVVSSKKLSSESSEEQFENALDCIRSERVFLHDISSPLTIAIGMTESATKAAENGEVDKALQKMEKVSQALTRIVVSLNARRKILIRETERHSHEGFE